MENNTFLIILRLAMGSEDPFRPPKELSGAASPSMSEGQEYRLVMGVLDPAHESVHTPFVERIFNESRRKTYNDILGTVSKMFQLYENKKSIFRDNASINEAISSCISQVGRMVFDLIPSGTVVEDWLRGVFSEQRRKTRHVTIITNDFYIPWFWMKHKNTSELLCEVCSLGMLGLGSSRTPSGAASRGGNGADREGLDAERLQALLIQGSSTSDLPLLADELLEIATALGEEKRRAAPVNANIVRSTKEYVELDVKVNETKQRELFRLVHYAGHWDAWTDGLRVGDDTWTARHLELFVHNSAMILDGCASSKTLQAWEEAKGMTADLIRMGALGCVVTLLPVKNDPIVAKVFWASFYSDLRLPESTTIGQALVKARKQLKEHFESIGSQNPSWAFYQLVGNPTVCPLKRSPHGPE